MFVRFVARLFITLYKFECYLQGGEETAQTTSAQACAEGVPTVPLNVSESISR